MERGLAAIRSCCRGLAPPPGLVFKDVEALPQEVPLACWYDDGFWRTQTMPVRMA